MILTLALLAGGLALPASAQCRDYHRGPSTEIFISGYLPCGSPIYSKRVQHGHRYHSERLSEYELRRYFEHQHRIRAQRELERQIARERYLRERYAQERYAQERYARSHYGYQHPARCR